MIRMTAIPIGKWSVGIDKNRGMTILSFQFADRESINLALSKEQAIKIAKAMRDKPKGSPSKSKRAKVTSTR